VSPYGAGGGSGGSVFGGAGGVRGGGGATTAHRMLRCNLITFTKAIECAGTLLTFLLQVETCAQTRLHSSNNGLENSEHSEWLQEHSALVHRRKMLLRIAECASLLLGRAAAVDGGERGVWMCVCMCTNIDWDSKPEQQNTNKQM